MDFKPIVIGLLVGAAFGYFRIAKGGGKTPATPPMFGG